MTDFSNWMGNLPPKLHTLPLTTLAIPGSHDSSSFYLDKKGPVGPDSSIILQELARVKLIGPELKNILFRWSTTQSKTITQQLESGVRYFDLRIASRTGSAEVFALHCLYSQVLEKTLNEVVAFLKSHPKEIALLDVNHIYKMTDFTNKQCMSMILEICGDKMCPFSSPDSLTLQLLWSREQQIIVFYDDGIAKQNPMFWPGDYIPSPWPRDDTVASLLSFLENNYQKTRMTDIFYVTQGVLTATFLYLLTHAETSLKEDLDEKVAKPFVDWLKTKRAGPQGINICIMDFVEMADYIPVVIGLNDALC